VHQDESGHPLLLTAAWSKTKQEPKEYRGPVPDFRSIHIALDLANTSRDIALLDTAMQTLYVISLCRNYVVFRSMAVDSSVLLLSCSVTTGALGNPSRLLLHDLQ